jgi:hypothetical protein
MVSNARNSIALFPLTPAPAGAARRCCSIRRASRCWWPARPATTQTTRRSCSSSARGPPASRCGAPRARARNPSAGSYWHCAGWPQRAASGPREALVYDGQQHALALRLRRRVWQRACVGWRRRRQGGVPAAWVCCPRQHRSDSVGGARAGSSGAKSLLTASAEVQHRCRRQQRMGPGPSRLVAGACHQRHPASAGSRRIRRRARVRAFAALPAGGRRTRRSRQRLCERSDSDAPGSGIPR